MDPIFVLSFVLAAVSAGGIAITLLLIAMDRINH